MAKIEIRCPACSKFGFIEISEEALDGVTRGLLAVNIPDGVICEHTFITYIDKNLDVRDYFMTDFKVELPKSTHEEKMKAESVPSENILDVDLIKLNLYPMLLTHILKSIFSRKKVVIISEFEFLRKHIQNFFEYITKDSFKVDISIVSEEEYNRDKKRYKEFMVFKDSEIIRNVDKIINPKKLKVEKQIVHKFISESDLGYSYIKLKNDVQRAYEICKDIMDLINDYQKLGKKEKLGKNQLINMFTERTTIKLSIPYMDFLLEIIKSYFNFDMSIISDYIFPALGI